VHHAPNHAFFWCAYSCAPNPWVPSHHKLNHWTHKGQIFEWCTHLVVVWSHLCSSMILIHVFIKPCVPYSPYQRMERTQCKLGRPFIATYMFFIHPNVLTKTILESNKDTISREFSWYKMWILFIGNCPNPEQHFIINFSILFLS